MLTQRADTSIFCAGHEFRGCYRRGDLMSHEQLEKVKGAWPESGAEFIFIYVHSSYLGRVKSRQMLTILKGHHEAHVEHSAGDLCI